MIGHIDYSEPWLVDWLEKRLGLVKPRITESKETKRANHDVIRTYDNMFDRMG